MATITGKTMAQAKGALDDASTSLDALATALGASYTTAVAGVTADTPDDTSPETEVIGVVDFNDVTAQATTLKAKLDAMTAVVP
jgi:hypothetical protein